MFSAQTNIKTKNREKLGNLKAKMSVASSLFVLILRNNGQKTKLSVTLFARKENLYNFN